MDNVSALLTNVTNRLSSMSDTPALDASVLLAHIVGKPRTWIMAHPELTLTEEQQERLQKSLVQLENGEPLPYVLRHWEFFGLQFDITSDVLIPRPETELLVEKAIAWLQESPKRRRLADVGTGSGVIAISIAVNIPYVSITATDISKPALEVAETNARKYNVMDRIHFVQCDLLPVGPQKPLDLICANLPYIPSKTLHSLTIHGREPSLALDGGEDGLDLIHRLLNIAPERLMPNGSMLLEIEATQGAQVLKLARELLPKAKIRLYQDLRGLDRLLEIAL